MELPTELGDERHGATASEALASSASAVTVGSLLSGILLQLGLDVSELLLLTGSACCITDVGTLLTLEDS